MLHCKTAAMKSPVKKTKEDTKMDKSPASLRPAEFKVPHINAYPVKAPTTPIKPLNPPSGVSRSLFSDEDISAVHDKENGSSRNHEGTPQDCCEDSGYLSLQNSQIHDEEDHVLGRPTATQENTVLSTNSSKGHLRTKSGVPVTPAVSTPVDCKNKRTVALSSTPSNPYLPILRFEQAVCEELARSYEKNKRYDWSVISKVAEEYPLDRVIGRHMGLEVVDMLSSLLLRNMKSILANILGLLGDLDLIRCRNVSKTWRKIICEDSAAQRRCQRAEQALRESKSSRTPACGLTRDSAMSRVVLSCVQTLASPSTSSASNQSSKVKKSASQTASHRLNEFVQAASSLKQHESLRSCRRCGSPATYSAAMQRATCNRSSCQFDFCTACHAPFHGSTPCRTVQVRSMTTPAVPGGSRSRRRIKRL